jgi:hypothetical protein
MKSVSKDIPLKNSDGIMIDGGKKGRRDRIYIKREMLTQTQFFFYFRVVNSITSLYAE